MVGHGNIKMSTVAATPQIRVAFLAYITPAWQAVDFPFLTTVETMPRHARILNA